MHISAVVATACSGQVTHLEQPLWSQLAVRLVQSLAPCADHMLKPGVCAVLILRRNMPGVTVGLPQPAAAAGNAQYTYLESPTPFVGNSAVKSGVGPFIRE